MTSQQAAGRRRRSSQPASEANEAQSRSAASESQEAAAAAIDPNQSSTRLVFGLGSRTNRLKHVEYAASRREQQATESSAHEATRTSPVIASSDTPPSSEQTKGPRQQRAGQTAANNSISATKEAASAPSAADQVTPVKAKPVTRANKRSAEKGPTTPQADFNTLATGGARNGHAKTVQPEASSRGEPLQSAATASADTKRMQFSIPPPRQLNSLGRPQGAPSVVSYAKSRIYDGRSLGADQAVDNHQLLSGSSGNSMSLVKHSPLKPPHNKQVDVSKARERWEGGEPFVKCKSRQRLAAAKANTKLRLHGAWSMSSVVATQQLQLQAALNSSNTSPRTSSSNQADSSMRILTRGSVLERVQQFERAPGTSAASTSTASGLNALACSELGVQNDPSNEASILIDTNLTTGSTGGPVELVQRPDSPTSKQALYKSRLASIQLDSNRQLQQLEANSGSRTGMSSASSSGSSSSSSITASKNNDNNITIRSPPASTRTRRPSLQRQSDSSASYMAIPKFYQLNAKPNTYELELQKKNIVACFDGLPERRAALEGPQSRRHFQAIAIACGFSEYFKEPLRRYVKQQLESGQTLAKRKKSVQLVNGAGGSARRPLGLARAASLDSAAASKGPTIGQEQTPQAHVSCEQFLACWLELVANSVAADNAARLVHLVTLGARNYILPEDLVPLIQSVIDDHPGLKFLRAAPDFHLRYIQTVIARIYYCINCSWTGRISLAELRKSNLIAVLQVLAQEEDINQITDYFSYEHFYVIYCKFWSLDQDHDLMISRDDLARHNDSAISIRIIERIFMGIVSRSIRETGKMSYPDFVWFLIAEEDKKHPRAIEYWFRLMDLDGDGYISMYEMEFFYQEQARRLELMNIEPLPFLDSACQILDLVNPREKNKISLSDLKRTKMATIFFDTFINLEKYLEHESREFVSTRDLVQDGVIISDWDRYASEEYESLVSEESSV